jgi:hypothetical protein
MRKKDFSILWWGIIGRGKMVVVGTISVQSWPAFTDHKVVTAHSTYQLGRQSEVKENVHLLEIGGKLKQLDFHKAD